MSGLDLDLRKAVVLALDYTSMIVEQFAFDGAVAVANASAVCTAARSAGVPVIHIAPGRFDAESMTIMPRGELHASMRPLGDDLLFYKQKIGAFSTTGLDVNLRLTGKDTLVIMGIATSGTVLSTSRWAFDLGYRIFVVADACSDPEADVHRILTEKDHDQSWVGLWRLGTVVTTQTFTSQLAGL